jgi:hypothetical protein
MRISNFIYKEIRGFFHFIAGIFAIILFFAFLIIFINWVFL